MLNASPVTGGMTGGLTRLSAGPVAVGGRRRRSGKLRLITKKRARKILKQEGFKIRGGSPGTGIGMDSSFIPGKGDDLGPAGTPDGPTSSYPNQAGSFAGGRRRSRRRRSHRRSHRRSRSRTLFGLHY
jgi:hypothetical protein